MSLQDHSAPGSSAGFTYQFERALLWLAKSPGGTRIGIETCDDVTVQQSGRPIILEQDKHSIQADGEPYGDRSKDLWNTLGIWLDALVAQEVTPDTAFFMVTNKVLPDCLAKKIAAAKTPMEADECIRAMIAAVKDPPDGIAERCKSVLQEKSRALLRTLILQINLCDGSGGSSLRAETVKFLPIPDSFRDAAEGITDELLGWMHQDALASWQSQRSAWISRDHFVNRLQAALDQRRRRKLRELAVHLLPVLDQNDVNKEMGRPFVQQLNFVTEEDSVLDNAIKDFLRCNLEKARLSKEGNITDDDWLAFQSALQTRWDRIQVRVKRNSAAKPDEDIGWEIFTETAEDYREKLAGQDTEQIYLTAGTYHRLADLLALGWHPEWKKLMTEEKKP